MILQAVAVFFALTVAMAACAPNGQTLEGFAKLPADTFAPGPTSGQFLATANGVVPPFVSQQPVQGFSSVVRTSSGDFLVMPDNGFGTKESSADFVLRVYRITPDFKTRSNGTGTIAVRSFITLRDPDHHVTFPIVADAPFYPGSTIPVNAEVKANRWLTGGDFDVESFREARDGTFWFGDEFGPFLIHTDASGRVLEPPYSLPGVTSPQNPSLGAGAPTLPRSNGFEGMAIAPGGNTLYPMLEGPLIADANKRRLAINQFDLGSRSYTGRQWFYRLEADSSDGQSIGDLTAVTDRLMLVIERDSFEGTAAAFKKIFLIDLDAVDADGFVAKQEVANLLAIKDPDNLAGFGPLFRFAFETIESVVPLSDTTLGVLDDNNYPSGSGRVPGSPDPNEFIIIKLERPLVDRSRTAKP